VRLACKINCTDFSAVSEAITVVIKVVFELIGNWSRTGIAKDTPPTKAAAITLNDIPA
jgi:hypothetical protein